MAGNIYILENVAAGMYISCKNEPETIGFWNTFGSIIHQRVKAKILAFGSQGPRVRCQRTYLHFVF